jgi:hypothetical protein
VLVLGVVDEVVDGEVLGGMTFKIQLPSESLPLGQDGEDV